MNGDNNDRCVISSSTSTSSKDDQQQQQSQKPLLQSVQNQATEDKNKRSINEIATSSPPSTVAGEDVAVVRMRNRPLSQTQQQTAINGTISGVNGNSKNSSLAVLQHGLEVLNEITTEDDGNEEIRKLDSQLDHLNHYMDKVEERIKTHNEKLMDTLKHQREEREKRRRSFHEGIVVCRVRWYFCFQLKTDENRGTALIHLFSCDLLISEIQNSLIRFLLFERIALNQQEDDDFQRQIATLLSRVDISKNRASMYDIISQMEIPKSNGQ
ncbi:unnamed protein product [Litomosoides sigmodontis]|uniref:Uncharacterized protein n=1 Tax=Litomosoides sigmodontis TaxID=42156 RepID=A0A3P6T3M3_LITSI|nr:unnamed protein product [Litomosoides sigmodontis]